MTDPLNRRVDFRFHRVAWCGLLIAILAPFARAEVMVDAAIPGGNAIVESIAGDTVRLKPDLRDTQGNWFYWCFRVREAQGQSLKFAFTAQAPVGVRGPAISRDGGMTWAWLGREHATNSSFEYRFGPEERSVLFSVGMTYTQANWDAFIKPLKDNPAIRLEKLCASRKGRDVERLHVGRLDGAPAYRVLVTARHHACEMMADDVMEGMISAMLADDPAGKWFREKVEVALVPFVDKDGVEDGDQGKNRKPRDHNRDYSDKSIYPETAALREWTPKWSEGKLAVMMDLHCPTLRGGPNERVYQVGKEQPAMEAQQKRFGKLLESLEKGSIVYQQKDDIPFGKEWNTAENFKQGTSSSSWGAGLPQIRLATTFELPYANAGGKEVNADSARAFGRDLAATLKAYLESPD